jgi:multiple sugar transport system permease protein
MSRRYAPLALFAPFGLLFAAFFLAPIGYAIYESLTEVERTGALGLGGQETVFAGLSNYADALANDAFVASVGRIVVFTVVQVPVMILLATVLALLLDSGLARWPRFFRTAYFMPFGVPGVIAAILWGFLYVPGVSPIWEALDAIGVDVDFLGSGTVMWSIVNIVTWTFAGYNMLIIYAQLQAVPGEIYEAARVDGASHLQIALKIKLPLARPAIVLATVFTIIGSLQLFAEPLVLRALTNSIGFDYTPNMAAYTQAFQNNNQSLAAAEAVLLALVSFVLSFGFLRIARRWQNT